MSARRRIFGTGLLAITATVLVTYWPALRLTFFGDDYLFIEVAGRSSFWQYLALYFDPRLQTAWYRPMQGMRYGIIYALFGANPAAYHWVNVLVHLINSLLLFAIIWRISRRWRMATVATVIYSGLPLYSIAVFWPGVADFVMTLFYLSAVLFWVLYLQESKRLFMFASVIFFVLALMTKELAVTLPITLFVVDRIMLHGTSTRWVLLKRCLPYLLILTLYLPMEYLVQSRGVFINTYGYGAGEHLFSNLLQNLAALVFPWGLPSPWNYLWLGVALLLFAYVAISNKSLALLGLAGIGVMTFLPVIPFPWFLTRYLYIPIMIFAILFSLWIEQAKIWLGRSRGYASFISAAIALLTIGHGLNIADGAADFAEIARQSRVPFRDISQRHAQFPNDTFLYFINPPSPSAEYSGMFFLRYGPGISVSSNENDGSAGNLRAHENSYVIYFDEERRTREIHVEKDLRLRLEPEPPLAFNGSLVLDRYELANSQAKRGEAIGIVLYFKSSAMSSEPFFVSLDLVSNATGKSASSLVGEPRVGNSPNTLIIFPMVLPIPQDAPASGDYRLEVGVMDSRQQLLGNKLIFFPLSVVE